MTFSAYHSPVSEAEISLRAARRAACQRFPDLPRIKTIASVGSLDHRIGYHSRDSSRLTHSLEYLLRSGFLIDPDFTVDAVNFKDNRDFLLEDHKADLIFVSYIIRNKSRHTQTFRVAAEGAVPPEAKDLICTLSHHHYEWEWTERARRAEAKLIVTYGGMIEIGAEYFCDPSLSEKPFQLLIPSPKEECLGSFQIYEMKKIYGVRNIDLPVAGLAFCADQQYLHQLAPAMTGATCLSRIARKTPDLGIGSAPDQLTTFDLKP